MKKTATIVTTKSGTTVLSGGDGGRRPFDRRTKLVVLFAIAIAAILLILGGWAVYKQLYPEASSSDASGLLAGIPEDSIRYDSMTPEQRNAQLKRQIGMSVDDLKARNVSDSLFRSHEDARMAALALISSREFNKAEQAYDVAYRKVTSSTSHEFFGEYGTFLSGQAKFERSSEILREAKERASSSKDLSDSQKKETLAVYERLIKLNASLATMKPEDL